MKKDLRIKSFLQDAINESIIEMANKIKEEARKTKPMTSVKKELTIREWQKARDRMCNDQEQCHDCPASYYCKGYKDIPEEVIDIVEQWAAEHPEETLEPVGDGIYFDPTKRLIPHEVLRVYHMDITVVGDGSQEMDAEHLKECGRTLASNISKAFPITIDDVQCVGAQQFITKCHEEEL